MAHAILRFARRTRRVQWVGFGCVTGFFWLTSACQTSCGTNNYKDPVLYVDGKTHTESSADGDVQVYESTPLNGEWLDYPGGRTYRLVHNFHNPNITTVRIWTAFSSTPMIGEAGDVASATGDVAVVEKLECDDILIRNNTCSQQYLYVYLTAPQPLQQDAGVCP